MAKRFTDTEKWRDEWWGSLSNDYRMIWLYLIDSCSIAGLWKKDFRGLNFNCNTQLTEEQIFKTLGNRIIDKGNFYFIPKFLRFQYPKGLNSNKPAIISVVKELHNNNLIQTVNKLFGNDYLIIKDKDKNKDKVKDKEKDQDRYIMVSEQLVLDPIVTLEFYEAQLNGMVRENGNVAWRPLVDAWFNDHLMEEFKDGMHVKNSFKKFYTTKQAGNKNGHTKETITVASILAKK